MAIEPIGVSRRPSLMATLTRLQIRWLLRPFLAPWSSLSVQRALAGSLRWLVPGPGGVHTTSVEYSGFHGERHVPAATPTQAPTILYLHGGGYSVCSPASHRGITQRLAKACECAVYVPRYRRAPEHPYPAQLQDAMAAMTALEAQGIAAQDIVLVGDSAGAHLALTLVLARRQAGQTGPRALVLISPWVDISLQQMPPEANDALLSPSWMAQVRDAYVRQDQWTDPLVSPIHASLGGLPPVLIQSSRVEQLANDARRLHQALADAGVDVCWQEWDGLWHDFQLHAGLVPEASDALARIASFIRQRSNFTQPKP